MISDALEGLKKAIQSRVATAIREVFVQPNHEKARDLWRAIAASAHNSLPKLAQAMDEAEEDVQAYMTFPKSTGHSYTRRTHWNA